MIARTMKPKCVLLDANIVIRAHEISVWEKLIEKVQIIIPSSVVHEAHSLFSDEQGRLPEAIDLKKLVTEQKIEELSTSVEESAAFLSQFELLFQKGLHEGETEALSLIYLNKAPDAFFCTGDAIAIHALAMINKSEQGISFESLLKTIGLQKSLSWECTEQFFQRELEKGKIKLITREGLVNKKV
jgi:hypothetical protein